jgi:hypothetical protein
VGGLGGDAREQRVRDLREIHDRTIVAGEGGDATALPRAEQSADVRS